MTPTAEKLLENVKALPKSERDKFFDFLEKEKLHTLSANEAEKEDEKFQLAMKWIQENRETFDGQWVALDGETLLASRTDGKRVHAEAQAKGVKVPFMHRISIKETEPFGGW